MPVQEHEEWPPGAWAELRVDVLSKDSDTGKYMVRYADPNGSFVDFEISIAGTVVNLPSPPADEPDESNPVPYDPDREPA